jgi:hypothetical protein
MIDSNIKDKVHWLNAFIPKGYIHPTMGPAGMILGAEHPNYRNLRVSFGAYCQVFDETTNDMKSRSVGGIALRPKNDRGSYYFMSLRTGRRIHATRWTELPITDEVIQRVDDLASNDGIN